MTINNLAILLPQSRTSQLFHTRFWLFLTDIQVSQDTGKMVWFSYHFKSFLPFVKIHTVKGFSVVNETKIDIFPEFLCFLYDPRNVSNLISGSSAFSKPSLDIWKFSVHVLLKPSMQNIEHNLTSMGDECNCPVVWTFLSTALLGNWNEDWPFPVLWPLLSFPNLLTDWMQQFYCIIFKDFK